MQLRSTEPRVGGSNPSGRAEITPSPDSYPGEGGETWRPVVGFEGWYEVSDLGRVKRVKTSAGARAGRILRPELTRTGYSFLILCRPGLGKRGFTVHKLVADAFLGPRAPGFEIDHLDGDKANPRLSNLEAVTRSENIRRRYARARTAVAASMLLAGRGPVATS